jgi:ketosteroid isomerase-like protein
MSDEVEVVRCLFDAVERRDPEGVLACYAKDVEINEAAVLPMAAPTAAIKVPWPTPRAS